MVKAVRDYLKLLPPSAQIVALMIAVAALMIGGVALASAFPMVFFTSVIISGCLYILAMVAYLIKALWLDD